MAVIFPRSHHYEIGDRTNSYELFDAVQGCSFDWDGSCLISLINNRNASLTAPESGKIVATSGSS